MRTVIIIEEDNHGLIGIAETYADAIDFLKTEAWLDEKIELYDDDEECQTIKEDLGEDWFSKISEWSLAEFNEYFEGIFFLWSEPIHKAS